MKIHRLVQMLGLINESGRLASDMYDLNNKTYYSEAEGKEIPISHMDFQHLVRAFVKQNTKVMMGANDIVLNEEDTIKAKDHIIDGLRSQVKTLNDIIEEKDEQLNEYACNITRRDHMINTFRKEEHRWRKAYAEEHHTQGHRYVFSEIPNDEYGKKLARGMKMYLNDESYTMRVRGQHIKPELKGTGKTSFGQSIEDSTHLRIYIDKKKGE
jgi:hypothetical protein